MIVKTPWQIRLLGPLGTALEHFCNAHLESFDFDRFLEPFILKSGPRCGRELMVWGQSILCALRCMSFLDNKEALSERVFASICKMMSLQEEDGAITAFPREQQLQGWDLLSRRSVLNALLQAFIFYRRERSIRECCVRMADQIISLVGPGKRSILYCGVLGGLDSSAIMESMVDLYRISKEKRFLDFACYIADCGCSQQHNIFEALDKNMEPALLGSGHAPALTACFKGLCALGAAAPEYEEKAKHLCRLYMERIAAEELFITGSGGNGDPENPRWCKGAFRQTDGACPPGSTAVTAACIEFFASLTDLLDPVMPAALGERSFYNALLGAWRKESSTFDLLEAAPLSKAYRKAAESSLFRLFRAAEALTLAPHAAATPLKDGLQINFYEDMEAILPRQALVRVIGGFPGTSSVEVNIRSKQPFTISLRVPDWCTGVYYCNARLACKKNSYLTMTRPWELDEILRLDFKPEVRYAAPPDGSFKHALTHGPLVMAAQLGKEKSPEHLDSVTFNGLKLIDFASAGKGSCDGEPFIVWFQRMFPDNMVSHLKRYVPEEPPQKTKRPITFIGRKR